MPNLHKMKMEAIIEYTLHVLNVWISLFLVGIRLRFKNLIKGLKNGQPFMWFVLLSGALISMTPI